MYGHWPSVYLQSGSIRLGHPTSLTQMFGNNYTDDNFNSFSKNNGGTNNENYYKRIMNPKTIMVILSVLVMKT